MSTRSVRHVRRGGPAAGPSGRLVSFPDVSSLLGSLESRSGDRRQQERRGTGSAGAQSQRDRVADLELCHDMRQPLAVIAALVASLQDEADTSAVGRRRLAQVAQEVTRLSDFISGHLAGPRTSLVDLGLVVRDAVSSAGTTFVGCIEVHVSGQAVVEADPVLLHRAVANVLDNACRVVGAGGTVRVSVWCGADGAQVDVDDDGPGMGASPSRGHGMGLSIVEAVLRRHGGDLDTTASELGGTCVRLRLPLAVPSQVGPAVSAAGQAGVLAGAVEAER